MVESFRAQIARFGGIQQKIKRTSIPERKFERQRAVVVPGVAVS